jgi:hypothetical protein
MTLIKYRINNNNRYIKISLNNPNVRKKKAALLDSNFKGKVSTKK